MARTVTADFRQLLQTKLGIGRAQLYREAEKITNSLSISTADAILLLAAKNHINLHKQGIEPDKIAEIRKLLPHVQSATPVAAVSDAPKRKARGKQPFRVKLPKAEDDPILAKGTHAEMQAMVPVYERLYHLENSIRQFITRVTKAKHGENWWDVKAPNGLKTHVTGRRADDQVNAWHQRRSNNPIDYLDLNQLAPLVLSTLPDFVPAFFPTMEWFQQFIDEVYRSRCVVCHMNPLSQNNIDAVGVRFNQWRELIKAKADDLERLEHPAAAPAVPAPAAPSPSNLPAKQSNPIPL